MQSVFILSPTGEVLIERHFRGVTSRTVVDYFWERASAAVNHHGGFSTTSSAFGGLDHSLHDTVPPIMEIPISSAMKDTSTSVGRSGDFAPVSSSAINEALLNLSQKTQQSCLYLFSILRDGLSYLAVCSGEVSPLLILEFLHRVADTFVDYFGNPADESAIKDNFSTVYQLLEEMVDYGWPLTTEPNALKAMIRPPTVIRKIQSVMTGGVSNAVVVSDALPSGTISNMPWRASGIKYNSNEIYIDIVEEIDAILDVSGNVISSDVSGSIQAQSQLSGVPDLLLTFKDPELIDDCSFHPCVRYGRFEQDKVVSFVPPDGTFELMRFRVRNMNNNNEMMHHGGIHPPVFAHPQWTFHQENNNNEDGGGGGGGDHKGRLLLTVGVRSVSSLILSSSRKGPLAVEELALTIPFPKSIRTANITVTQGVVIYDEAAKIAKWELGKLDSAKRHNTPTPPPQLQATVEFTKQTTKPSNNVSIHWKIPLASVSGLTVNGLSITGESYKPYKGVRNITKSGTFQVRCS